MKNYTDYSEQHSAAPGLPITAFGASLLPTECRAVHSNVTRSFKCTTATGTRVVLLFAEGQNYLYRLTGISAASGTAISSVSSLVIPIM